MALIACSASPTPSTNTAVTALRAPSAARPLAAAPSTVLVSDESQNSVVICVPGSACSDCKTVGSGLVSPVGLTTSNSGPGPLVKTTLDYVADSGNQRVVVFNDQCETVRVLGDSGYFPSDVAVANDGTVAVTNLCAAPSCKGAGNIAFFAPGAMKPTRVATGLMSQYLYGAFDKQGNFYNDGLAGSTVEIGVVARKSKVDKATGISGIGAPGGIEVAHDGTVNIVDQDCDCIQIYKGSTLTGTVSLPGVTTPVSFALDKKNKHLWVTDASSKTVDELPYPKGGKILDQLSGFSEPGGVGVEPPSKP
jgi:hypothetical protein